MPTGIWRRPGHLALFLTFLVSPFVPAPSISARADCIDYGEYLRWIGRMATPGAALDVALSGSRAYIADDNGFCVVDITDPTDLRLMGRVDTPVHARGVAVVGYTAYVADDSNGLLQAHVERR